MAKDMKRWGTMSGKDGERYPKFVVNPDPQKFHQLVTDD
jgi:hypothetical protein